MPVPRGLQGVASVACLALNQGINLQANDQSASFESYWTSRRGVHDSVKFVVCWTLTSTICLKIELGSCNCILIYLRESHDFEGI